MCHSILDTLQSFDHGGRESSQERVAVVSSGVDQHLDQELSSFPREERKHAEVVESKSAGWGHHWDVRGAA